MNDEQLYRCILDELRKAQKPLTEDELFERCGGMKITQHSVESLRSFIAQNCSRVVKAVQNPGDENSLPRYTLRVDSICKSGTLKRRLARSQSRSSSRGGTPDFGPIRFSPRKDGYPVLSHIVQRFCANSKDGTINWNAVRNQYRKETGRHLNTEELNGICGTVNMTRHDLLSTHLSTMVEILDRRGQIVKLAASFSPKRPNVVSPHSHSSPEGEAPSQASTPFDSNKSSDRRQHIVEQLRRMGVFVDENGRTSILEDRQSLSSESTGQTDADTIKMYSGSFGDMVATSESGQTSFCSANQFLETSGEAGYATGYEASPESDISLDVSIDRTAQENTLRRLHDVTLCNVETWELHREVKNLSHKTRNSSTPKDDNLQNKKQIVNKQDCRSKFDDQTSEEENCSKEMLVKLTKSGKFTSAELISSTNDYDDCDYVGNQSGDYCKSVSTSNNVRESEDGYLVFNSEDSLGTDDVFEENDDALSSKPFDHSDGSGKQMNSGQEASSAIKNTPVKKLSALFEGKIDTFDVEKRVELPLEHFGEFYCIQESGIDLDARNSFETNNIMDDVYEMPSPDFGRKVCFEMDPIPDDVHVTHKYISERHKSLPISLEYTQILYTGKSHHAPASDPCNEIGGKEATLTTSEEDAEVVCQLSCPENVHIESMTIKTGSDNISGVEELPESEEFSSNQVAPIDENFEENVLSRQEKFINSFFFRRRFTGCCSLL